MNNHNSDVRQKKKCTGMVRYFADYGIHDIQPIILERTKLSDLFICKARAQFYINVSGT